MEYTGQFYLWHWSSALNFGTAVTTVTTGMIRVPTAPGKPGKMTKVFPVLEKYWNFIILLKILEKWEWTWKNELSGEKIVLSWLLQHSFLLYRALPIKMYIWENSGILGLLWCFQMTGYMGQLGLACSWIPRREIEPQLLVAPSLSSEVCPHCIYHWLTLPGGRGEG